MAKCRRHIYDQIGGGVCASCLRERLLALLADPDALPTVLKRSRSRPLAPPQPPPLDFPRSVSPYVTHRRSLHDEAFPPPTHLQRFYSTPQARRPPVDREIRADLPRKRFFVFPFFVRNHRSRSEDVDSDPKQKRDFWLSVFIGGRRRKSMPAAPLICPAEGGGGRRSSLRGQERACRPSERGMSPARYGDNSSDASGSSRGSGSPGWRQPLPTPMRNEPAPAGRRPKRGVSGFAVCFSPLMRANPNCRLNPAAAAEGGLGGDARHHHHRCGSSGSAWLAHNRSRKLAQGPS